MSVAKGFDWMYSEAKRLGCEAIQLFVKNPRSWSVKEWKDEELEAFSRLSAEFEIFSHLSYLPNLAKVDLDERNLAGLVHEAELSVQLGIKAMVVHCGSRDEADVGLETAASAINRVLEKRDITILLENSSGQGNSVGRAISELGRLFDGVARKERVGLCIDTAHLFESGCDMRRKIVAERVFKEVEERFGPGKIGLFHLNDSKTDLGSMVDRHWHIGKGKIGLPLFRRLLNDVRFVDVCGVMETPKADSMDEENMKTMKSLLSPLVPRPFS